MRHKNYVFLFLKKIYFKKVFLINILLLYQILLVSLFYIFHSINSTRKTYHYFNKNFPFLVPVNASLVYGFLLYFPLLKLIGNSHPDFYLSALSEINKSQHPKIGPRSGLLAIANWGRLSLYFSLRSREKIKVFCYLSILQFFFYLFHNNGV